MSTSRLIPLRLGIILFGLAACGDDRAVVVVDVDLHDFAVTEEIDRLHFRTIKPDGNVFLEMTLPLSPDMTRPALTFVQGPRTPDTLDVIVFGDLGLESVAQSEPAQLRFKPGTVRHVAVVMSR